MTWRLVCAIFAQISQPTHDLLCRCGHSQTWCSCAYKHNRYRLVGWLDRVAHSWDGENHCERQFLKFHE